MFARCARLLCRWLDRWIVGSLELVRWIVGAAVVKHSLESSATTPAMPDLVSIGKKQPKPVTRYCHRITIL